MEALFIPSEDILDPDSTAALDDHDSDIDDEGNVSPPPLHPARFISPQILINLECTRIPVLETRRHEFERSFISSC